MRWTVVVAVLVLVSGLGLSGTVTHAQTISIADASVTEGDSGTKPLDFTLTLSPPSALTVTVEWRTANGTATHQDGDYVRVGPPPAVVTFDPLQTTEIVTVTIAGDGTIEPSETFFVDLASPTGGATLGDSQAMGTIINDDPVVSINDVSLPEGDIGTTAFVFEVTLSTPSPSLATVNWTTVDDTATTADGDYVANSGTAIFPAFTTLRTVTVTVNGDTTDVLDEAFFVNLTGGGGGRFLKAQGVGTILDDDAPYPPVEAFSAVSDSGRNTLQWLTSAGTAITDTFIIRFKTAAAQCQLTDYPDDPTVTSPDPLVPGIPGVMSDSTQSLEHTGLTLDQWYCYSFWVDYGAGIYAGPETVKASPFDSTGAVKRKYYTSTTTLAAPTVTLDAVIVPSNNSQILAMQRDPASLDFGRWPTNWRPRKLESVVQHRVPYGPRSAGGWQALIATELGWVHAVDTATGNLWWSTWLPVGKALGAPAAIFTAFGGAYDYVLVGTSQSGGANRLYALDPDDGRVLDAFPMNHDNIFELGEVLGMPSVDYANRRAFFAARTTGTSSTLKGLELGPLSDALKLAWEYDTDHINGSLVLHNGRVYAGDASGDIFSLRASDGGDALTVNLGSEVKGFLFPDRRGNDLYVATDAVTANVWAITDTGTDLNHDKWGASEPVLEAPSVVLYHPGTDDIYVGVRDYLASAAVTPAIVKLSALDGSYVSHVDLESVPPVTLFSIGPPSLDLAYGMLYMGSEAGIIYTVALSGF